MKNRIFIFRGTSMSPFFRSGDRVHIRKIPWDRLKIGDLVATQPLGFKHPIIHRLVGWQMADQGRFGILKGDNLPNKDDFYLTQQNYTGKVWARERNRQFLDLNRLSENSRAKAAAFLSIFNLTPGVLRRKIKKTLERILPQIPFANINERRLLENAKYYFFRGPGNRRRVCVVWRGLNLGEVIFQNNPASVLHSSVFSVFSALISAEKLVLYSGAKFPELFQPEIPNRTGAEA